MAGSNLLNPGMPGAGGATQAPRSTVDNAGLSNASIMLLIQQYGQNTVATTELIDKLSLGINGDVTGSLPGPVEVVATHLAAPLPMTQGGLGLATLTQYGILIGQGTSPVNVTAAMTDGQILVGHTNANPVPTTIAGGGTLSASGILTITSVDLISPLPVTQGGTGGATYTAHGILIGEGAAPLQATAAMTNGQLLIGQTGADPLPKTMSGDATLAASGAITISATGGTNFGPYATAVRGQLVGTNTNDNAAAGDIGEEMEGVVASGAATALTTVTAKSVTSITLTPGDWDVWAYAGFTGNAATTVNYVIGSISTTNNTLDQTRSRWASKEPMGATLFATLANVQFACGEDRFSVSTNTVVYLIAEASFATNTCSAFGTIIARRRR